MRCSKCGKDCDAKSSVDYDSQTIMGDCKAVSMCCDADILMDFEVTEMRHYGVKGEGTKDKVVSEYERHLRDKVAMHVLPSVIFYGSNQKTPEYAATEAFRYADAFIKERNKEGEIK
jgi:hypothetical protein